MCPLPALPGLTPHGRSTVSTLSSGQLSRALPASLESRGSRTSLSIEQMLTECAALTTSRVLVSGCPLYEFSGQPPAAPPLQGKRQAQGCGSWRGSNSGKLEEAGAKLGLAVGMQISFLSEQTDDWVNHNGSF